MLLEPALQVADLQLELVDEPPLGVAVGRPLGLPLEVGPEGIDLPVALLDLVVESFVELLG